MKIFITVSILVISTLGGWIGQLMDHGNWLGGWSIVLGTIGGFVGVYVGFKAGRHFGV
ncbi:hypothetical protein M1512_00625 [Patescibacteria group bacterium]|jgi:hypothetical protein|nr:hypothetical protein [Patescibacteria group bacterium]